MPDQEIRCCACARLLFKMQAGALVGALSVKCPRCRAFNHLRPPSPNPERDPAPDPLGAKT
ncbi:MAG: Com family DNA-binding transcriptional regulator [Pseudorhodobacter sp. PARRP1]|nr:MAG: Com family DNA-binding transcriptional regulator [Pseudorhodobacter sp. PARRP1]